MTKGGLNIKDYPFAFSIAALIFPNILSGENFAPLLTITLVGGMLGSLLTIINPVGLLIKGLYLQKANSVFPKMHLIHVVVHKIIIRNFRASLSSPAIAYETDKMVGMIYFLIILAIAFYRIHSDDFIKTLDLSELEISGITVGVIFGFAGVIIMLIHHIFGFSFHSKRATSHLDRISGVTALNLAVDFSNLFNEATKWRQYRSEHSTLASITVNEFRKFGSLEKISLDEFRKKIDISKIERAYQRLNYSWDKERNTKLLFEAYKSLRELCLRYDLNIEQGSSWFINDRNAEPTIFDATISQLQSSIDSRDWYNVGLKTYRVTDTLESMLTRKVWTIREQDLKI